MLVTSSLHAAPQENAPIHFDLQKIPFRLENDETTAKNAPEAMAGGVAVFDYNGDGRPDIFFTNGADIATLNPFRSPEDPFPPGE